MLKGVVYTKKGDHDVFIDDLQDWKLRCHDRLHHGEESAVSGFDLI